MSFTPNSPNLDQRPNPVGFTVTTVAAALSGQSPSGFTLKNASTGGQIIWLGNSGVVAASSGANAGFSLPPGAAIDRERWEDLAAVYAIASASGAILEALPL